MGEDSSSMRLFVTCCAKVASVLILCGGICKQTLCFPAQALRPQGDVWCEYANGAGDLNLLGCSRFEGLCLAPRRLYSHHRLKVQRESHTTVAGCRSK